VWECFHASMHPVDGRKRGCNSGTVWHCSAARRQLVNCPCHFTPPRGRCHTCCIWLAVGLATPLACTWGRQRAPSPRGGTGTVHPHPYFRYCRPPSFHRRSPCSIDPCSTRLRQAPAARQCLQGPQHRHCQRLRFRLQGHTRRGRRGRWAVVAVVAVVAPSGPCRFGSGRRHCFYLNLCLRLRLRLRLSRRLRRSHHL
jgi:hypothetical protein